MHRMLTAVLRCALCLALLATQACSVRQYALNTLGDAIAGGGDTYAADGDIELVGAATPFGLKTIESLLSEVPEHRGLLLAAARGFTQYAYVYVHAPAELLMERDVAAGYSQLARARALYVRARDYGLRGLRQDPGRRCAPVLDVRGLGGRQAGPYVSLAESVCVEKRARREFEALLRQALQVDADARPEWRLANLVMQRRAHHLLERAGELFPE